MIKCSNEFAMNYLHNHINIKHYITLCIYLRTSLIATFMGPTWGPPGSCWPQMSFMLSPWALLSGMYRAVWNLSTTPMSTHWDWVFFAMLIIRLWLVQSLVVDYRSLQKQIQLLVYYICQTNCKCNRGWGQNYITQFVINFAKCPTII